MKNKKDKPIQTPGYKTTNLFLKDTESSNPKMKANLEKKLKLLLNSKILIIIEETDE